MLEERERGGMQIKGEVRDFRRPERESRPEERERSVTSEREREDTGLSVVKEKEET